MVWADSRWIDAKGDWLEARSTAMGVLGTLDLPYGEPDSERSFDAIFSLVVDRSEGKTRQLPTLYFGGARVYVHRDLDTVANKLVDIYKDVLHAPERPTYQLAACRVGDRAGLYLADFCNRTVNRQRLTRQGLEFSDSPFVRFTERGTFECDDWGEFPASFLVLTGNPDEPEQLVRPSRGYLLLSFASLRLGDVRKEELARLSGALLQMDAVGADDPAVLVQALAG